MIKMISLNIEGDNHYDKIFPFFTREMPDVVCLMEVFEIDLPQIAARLSSEHCYLVCDSVTQENPYRLSPKGNQGIALLSKYPITDHGHFYYETYRTPSDGSSGPNMGQRGVLWAKVQTNKSAVVIAATHFTWSPNGSVTDLQHADLENLLEKLEPVNPNVLCGDFNAPRGGEIFSKIAESFTDNIPKDVKTTLDPAIHRAGSRLPDLVVDGLFTRGYTAQNVRVISGVSDHCAIVGEIYE